MEWIVGSEGWTWVGVCYLEGVWMVYIQSVWTSRTDLTTGLRGFCNVRYLTVL